MAEIVHLIRTAPPAFLRWWLGELGGLLPGWLKGTNDRARAALLLEVDEAGAELFARTAKGTTPLGRAGGDGPDDLVALRSRRHARWPLIVRLAPSLGLRKVIDLPLAARDDLANLLHFELDRLTPFRPDEVSFAWRVLRKDQAGGRMTVALEMAPRSVVERATALAGAHGRSVDRIEIAGSGGTSALNLLPDPEKPESGGRLSRLLPILVLGLAVLAVWIPISRQQRVVDQLEQEVAALKSSAEETRALRDRLDAMATTADFLVDAKNGRVSMTGVLAELTTLLPDHSHLLQLDIEGDDVELTGLADKASDLIAILDRSTLFTSPEFRSAQTRDPRIDKERFQIAVKLAGPPS